MANNGPTYTRLGPGDLPGDSSHPNSPDYVEPAFGMDEAISDVADKLIQNGDVGEIIEEVNEAVGVLSWISSNVDLPAWGIGSFRALLRRADSLGKMAESEYEALNAPSEPDDE